MWGDGNRFPEPIAMVDLTDAGAQPTGTPEVFHYLRDGLGSVVGLTDESGNLVERYTYDPYGKTYIERWNGSAWTANICGGGSPALRSLCYSAFGNPFAWTAQRYDAATGTYGFWARIYLTSLGRWGQRDPIGYNGGSINLYEYVRAAPLRRTDPFGLYDLNDEEQKLYKDSSYIELLNLWISRKTAEAAVSDPKYDGTRHNGSGDAVRHCTWNCEMARSMGRNRAKKWGDAHEANNCTTEQEKMEKDMDLHNNEVGRELADKGNTPPPQSIRPLLVAPKKSCKDLCEQALKDGRLTTLPKGYWQ